jgi:hypothetical protein
MSNSEESEVIPLGAVKAQILAALRHPEAEEGLYFRNFSHLHEEDERPMVEADEVAVLDALRELMDEGLVRMDETGPEAVFYAQSC